MAENKEQHKQIAADATLRALTEHALDIVAILDVEGNIRYESPSLERVLGWRPNELIGQSAMAIIHPEDAPRVAKLLADNISNFGAIATTEYRCQHRDGSWRILESIATNRLHDPEVQGIVVNSRDITQRKEQEAALRSSNERFEKAFEYAAIGMAIVALDGTWVKVNAAICGLLGYSARELAALTFHQITHPDDLTKDVANVESLLRGSIPYYHMEKRYIHKNGNVLWAHLAVSLVRDEVGNPVHFLSQVQDITERKSAEARLLYDALHDNLTGLANRALLGDHVNVAYNRFTRLGNQFALLLIDVDRFKNINDTMGHFVGDQVLLELAKRLQNCLRTTDTVARLGGDEFAILLEDISGENTPTRVADRLLLEMQKPIHIDGLIIETSGSIGVVVVTTEHLSTDAIFRDADIALYRAKAAGRGNYQVFDQQMHARIRDRMELEHELRRALGKNQMALYLQPIVSLDSGRISSFEALIRWHHPTRGIVSPAEFIPIAEETGLIISLGSWVVRRVCQILREWPGGKPPPVSINASPVEILRPMLGAADTAALTYDQRLLRILDQENVSSDLLRIEVTESVLIDDLSMASQVMQRLTNSGFKLLLDDFGTGYSSLSYLQDLPFYQVKLDPSFTARLQPESRGYHLINGIIKLAHTIGMEVVAEGIETTEQFDLIKAARCDKVQGYHIARPLQVADAYELFQNEGNYIESGGSGEL